jgi:hypothetical protein
MDSASRRGTLAGRSRRTRASAAGLVQIGFVSEQHQEKSRIIIPRPANSIRFNPIGFRWCEQALGLSTAVQRRSEVELAEKLILEEVVVDPANKPVPEVYHTSYKHLLSSLLGAVQLSSRPHGSGQLAWPHPTSGRFPPVQQFLPFHSATQPLLNMIRVHGVITRFAAGSANSVIARRWCPQSILGAI